MFGTIKNYLIVILAGAALLCFAMFQSVRAGRAKDKLNAQKKAGEIMNKALKAIEEGRKRKAKTNESTDSDGSHFTK